MKMRKARVRVRNGRRWDSREIEIPTDDEIKRLAESLHAARQSHRHTAGDLTIRYEPSSSQRVTTTTFDPFDHDDLTVEESDHTMPSRFEIRLGSYIDPDWRVFVTWRDGDDVDPIWILRENKLLPPLDARQGSLFADSDGPNEELPSTAGPLFEGAAYAIEATVYERNRDTRQHCLTHYGVRCFVCGFDFGTVYGPAAEGFIHVHHIVPISAIGEEYIVDPIADLRPLCPNCHAVAHLRTPPFSVDEIKALLHRNKGA
jgi:predicted HNH restriction endonuclease